MKCAFSGDGRRVVAAVAGIVTAALLAGQAAAQMTPKSATRPVAVKSTADTRTKQGMFMRIQDVKSPGGISAWLVESHNVPLLALRFAFEGGNVQDPHGKEGLANFMTAMMDEGAGDIDASAFQEQAEEIAMRMRFSDSLDHVYGSLETLTVNRDKAINLLRLAVTKPRFDADAVERIKKQLTAGLAFGERDPSRVSSKAWNKLAYGDHPYGRPADGSVESITSITGADLNDYHRRVFAKSTLRVVAVGDIDAETLGKLLDTLFGDLPAQASLAVIPPVKLKTGGALEVVEMPVPQSVAQFGATALMRKDPDFMAAFVVNQILGGGGFASRLMEEVREKRGLAYSVYSYLSPQKMIGTFGGGVATKNSEMVKSLDVIKTELKRMATEGPTAKELENAKSYLTGSYALRFDSNSSIANQLLAISVESLGIDYIDRRNAEIEAVTIDTAKRAAARLINVDDMIVTVVGKPEGLKPTKPMAAAPKG